jgi:hypothetical protein
MSKLIINNKEVSWSFWHRILKKCGGNVTECGRIFYRAHVFKAKDPLKWISSGMSTKRPPEERYALKQCLDEEFNPMKVEQWIDRTIFSVAPPKKEKKKVHIKKSRKEMPTGMGDILEGLNLKRSGYA